MTYRSVFHQNADRHLIAKGIRKSYAALCYEHIHMDCPQQLTLSFAFELGLYLPLVSKAQQSKQFKAKNIRKMADNISSARDAFIEEGNPLPFFLC